MDTIAPNSLPVRGNQVRKGFYIARRRNWSPTACWVVIMVMPDEDGELRVNKPGARRVDLLARWIFHSRITHMESLPPGYIKDANLEDAVAIH